MKPFQTKWLFYLAVALPALLAQVWPDGLTRLCYDRAALAQGEYWRILTAHFVHLGWQHILFDLLGLALIVELLWGELPLRHGFGLLFASAFAITAALWNLQPEVAWYAGLSGVTYGVWAGCAVYGLPRLIPALAMLLLMARLTLEAIYGADATLQGGGDIVLSAHLYGAMAGIIYALVLRGIQFAHREKMVRSHPCET